MNVATPEQIERLPKWAQNELRDAHRRANDAESKLKDYLDNQSQSFVYTRNGLTEKSFIQDDRVSFQLKGGEITVALRDGKLECHGAYGGGQRLVVVPHVTNVVWLELEDRE